MAALAAALAGLLVALAAATAGATTESSDAAALGNLYTSWNSPSQLAGWSASGGDPCGAVWQGITCTGSGVTEIKLAGTGLNGSLGYELSNLYSLKTLDLSNNNIRGSIPYQLPPNLTYLNLATNNFSGNLPYSISNMASIEYLSGSIHAFSSADALIFFVWTMVFFGSCKVQVEKAKQDDALSDLSDILTELKGMAIDMGSETGRQTSDLGHAEKDFDELNFRVKGKTPGPAIFLGDRPR